MLTFPLILLAVSVGVVLAALDGPYPHSTARTERASLLIMVLGAVTMTAGGALIVRGWLPG